MDSMLMRTVLPMVKNRVEGRELPVGWRLSLPSAQTWRIQFRHDRQKEGSISALRQILKLKSGRFVQADTDPEQK
jgi:hypothetical protein